MTHAQLPRRYVLIAVMLALAWTQAGMALRTFGLPADLSTQVTLPPQLDLVAGTAWALAFGVGAGWLWNRHPEAVSRALLLVGVFILYNAARTALYAQADYERGRLPLYLLAGGIVVLLSILLRLWRKMNGDHQSQEVNSAQRAD